jgi:hypothetical protein
MGIGVDCWWCIKEASDLESVYGVEERANVGLVVGTEEDDDVASDNEGNEADTRWGSV